MPLRARVEDSGVFSGRAVPTGGRRGGDRLCGVGGRRVGLGLDVGLGVGALVAAALGLLVCTQKKKCTGRVIERVIDKCSYIQSVLHSSSSISYILVSIDCLSQTRFPLNRKNPRRRKQKKKCAVVAKADNGDAEADATQPLKTHQRTPSHEKA